MNSPVNTTPAAESGVPEAPASTNNQQQQQQQQPTPHTDQKPSDSGTVNSAFQAGDREEQGEVRLELPVVEGDKVMSHTAGKATYSKRKGTEYSPLLLYDPLSPEDPTGELRKNAYSFRVSQVILFLVFLVAGVALVSGLVFDVVTFVTSEDDLEQEEAVLGVLEADPGSRSPVGEYRFAAVAADAGQCSSIGTYIMAERQGSAVDAAIASLLCLGIHNAHSMGIGGGHFMMIYDVPKGSNTTKREMFSLDARETAPGDATINMFANASSAVGGLSIGVPGEIRGFHAAWRRFGRLPWRELFQPVLRMCREGYTVQRALGDAIQNMEMYIRNSPAMSKLYLKPDGTLYKEGDVMTSPRLADTFERIAEDGPETFYTGKLADDVISDLNDCGSIISKKDLVDYKAVWRQPSVSRLRTGNYTVHVMPPPSSGPALLYMLNILEGYNLKGSDVSPDSATRTLTYHRIAETLKFGYARRSFLGDPSFENLDELVANLSSPEYAARTRANIDDDQTHDPDYYHPANHALPKAAGTSHLSIIGPDGEAVSVTSTINSNFGSKCRGPRTGIIFNDEMDDFNTPGDKSSYGFTAATANFIRPGKRPLSSMVPTIVLGPDGEPVYVVGGSGGLKIATAVTYVTAHALFLGKSLNEAIDEPRLHHQLIPNILNHEPAFDKHVLHGLEQRGHELEQKNSLAVVQGIYSECGRCRPHCKEPCLYATSDVRKGGYPDGY